MYFIVTDSEVYMTSILETALIATRNCFTVIDAKNNKLMWSTLKEIPDTVFEEPLRVTSANLETWHKGAEANTDQ